MDKVYKQIDSKNSCKNMLIVGVIIATLMNIGLFFNFPDQSHFEKPEPWFKDDKDDDTDDKRFNTALTNHQIILEEEEQVKNNDLSTKKELPHVEIRYKNSLESHLLRAKKEVEKRNIENENAIIEAKKTPFDIFHISQSHKVVKNKASLRPRKNFKEKEEEEEVGISKVSDDDVIIKNGKYKKIKKSSYHLPSKYYPRARNAKYKTKQDMITYESENEVNMLEDKDVEGSRLVFFLHVHKR